LKGSASIIKEQVTNLDSKFVKLSEIVDKTIFTADEAARALDVKKSSAYWILHNLVKRRHLNRVSRGYYAVVPSSPVAISAPSLSRLAAQIVATLHSEGIRFYVTGLDILTSFFDQVPASFPPLIYVEAGSADWASRSLEGIAVPILVNPKKGEISIARTMRSDVDPVIVRETAEFALVNGFLASTEKAFIDVYYEITRGYYEFPVNDLAHMLINYYRRGQLNPIRMVSAARRRRIDREVRYMLDVCFGVFHERSLPTIRLSQSVQQFIRAVQKICNQEAHGQNR
jgi:hypothetical protein